ncbi:MAG: L-histidine N(alpha)-methyltransferase [Salibacteraceae bacterium]
MAVYRNSISEVEMDKEFLFSVIEGLSQPEKKLSSMYFYDDEGSRIFQEIMAMPEYYLTNSEYEILSEQGAEIANSLSFNNSFRLIELGAGDGTKTFKLIENLKSQGLDFEYIPIDVSQGALDSLEEKIIASNLNVNYTLKQGDYFEVLSSLPIDKPAVYLFLGANIGNFVPKDAFDLVKRIGDHIQKGDVLITGFDLKKNPLLIHQAYFDPHGITKRFNLNLLNRINNELVADFVLGQFDFYCHYNPINGEVRSYLVSLVKQTVSFYDGTKIEFERFELVNTELSKKYDLKEIENLAKDAGFEFKNHFIDSQRYFTDSLWVKN